MIQVPNLNEPSVSPLSTKTKKITVSKAIDVSRGMYI